MNDLMTRSFMNYVELKKQALKDIGEEMDAAESGDAYEENFTLFFEEVGAIKSCMEEITNYLIDLQDLNEEAKSTHGVKILKGIRDRINSDMVAVLKKATLIKAKLESLDTTKLESISSSPTCVMDHTKTSVINGLRVKLKEMMSDFQSLRERILLEHKEGLKRCHFNATGEEPSDQVLEKMMEGRASVKLFERRGEAEMERKERSEAVKDLQRSLTELHKLFLDMAVMVDTQGEKANQIEENVVKGGAYINGGTNSLYYANSVKKRREKWGVLVGLLILLTLLLICLLLSFS